MFDDIRLISSVFAGSSLGLDHHGMVPELLKEGGARALQVSLGLLTYIQSLYYIALL